MIGRPTQNDTSKSETLRFRATPEFKQAIHDRMAELEIRTLTEYIEGLIEKDLKKKKK